MGTRPLGDLGSAATEAVIDLDVRDCWAHLVPPPEALSPGCEPNESVYSRETVEKTRRSKWPNSPWIKTQQPNHYTDIFEDHFFSRADRFITPATPIGSMGSCFATRIAHQLQLWGFNYVIEEDDWPAGRPLSELTATNYRAAPARFGTLFDVPSMRQVVERAFGLWSPPRLIAWHERRIVDPFRTLRPTFRTVEEYEADREAHTAALRRALLRCDVFVLTLGLTEAWQFVPTGDYVSVPQLARAPELFRRRRISLAENVAELERILEVYRAHKPDIKFIISVSPVPLNKTFTSEHIVVANSLSKAVLRVAAEDFVSRHRDVAFYFPSYETVLYGTREPWEEDMRHVSPAAVERVMRLFQKMFLVDQDPLPVSAHTPEVRRRRFPAVRKAARVTYRLLKLVAAVGAANGEARVRETKVTSPGVRPHA